MEYINYFWSIVFNSMVEAIVLLLVIAIMILTLHMMQEWYKVRKEVLKYKKGYNDALDNAIENVNKLYEEWESDDPFSSIPCQKNITDRLEGLKNVSSRNIPTE